MRIQVQVAVRVSIDPQQQQRIVDSTFSFDDSDPTTAQRGGGPGQITLAPGATSVLVVMPVSTAASFFLLVAQQKVQVQLGSNTAPLVDVDPIPANVDGEVLSTFQEFTQPGIMLIRGKVASAYLTNPSGTTPASVFISAVGEAS